MPDKYIQNLLGDKEKILLVTRRHWFTLVREILPEAFSILIILTLFTIIWIMWVHVATIALGYILVLIPVISLLRDYLVWVNHKYIVTSRRVIQIFGIFAKNVTDSSLEKVNDVKMDQSFWGRIFNFGDIEILTASELGVNRFTHIGEPIVFKTTMLNAKTKMEKEQVTPEISPSPSPAPDITENLIKLDNLRQKNVISEEEFQRMKNKLLSQFDN
jgi:uncharacterized membrane protein YdbT with pleckstrin-like domain